MDEDALEVLADIAAPGADAQGGEQRGAQHVEPADPCGDAQAGLAEVLDGGFFADDPGDTGEEALEAPGGGRPMAAIVAVESDTEKRSCMSSRRRFSGTNWACSR